MHHTCMRGYCLNDNSMMSTKNISKQLGLILGGGFAEYVKVRVILSATGANSIPTEVSFEQASFGAN